MRRLRFALLGAALAYFFDPDNGKARRKAAIKRLAALRRGDAVAAPDVAMPALRVQARLL